ncbi:hemicentin-1-like [Hydractinia symbiolongicarpus]|uniref:hemicentin-1-like n=1 Tax=Hydractinia symbiolongicarpus TaxID=13093 RepID=UPI00254EFEAB|nr:hemicentin-1-like [Hydractinia symbiolongicarpus]
MSSFKAFLYATHMLLFIHGSLHWPLPKIRDILLRGLPPIEGIYGKNILTLECKHSGESNVTISWTFNGKKIHERGQYFFSLPEILRVFDVTNRNNGVYRCYVGNKYGTVFSEFNFKVNSLGSFEPCCQLHDETRIVKATLGESLTLKCPKHSTGRGQHYFWGWSRRFAPSFFLETHIPINQSFIDKSGSFVIPRLKEFDVEMVNFFGGISCVLHNNKESVYSCSFLIDAQKGTNKKSSPTLVSYMDKEFSVVEGRSVDIVCGAAGNPTPLISWYKDGVKIVPKNGSAAGNIEIIAWNTWLRIDPVLETDFGVYKCVARNSLGEDSKEGVLLVHSEPSWKIKLPNALMVVHNDVITLVCSTLGYPAAQYSLYHNDTLLMSSRPHYNHPFVYSIANAEFHHGGVYTCVASNVYKTITSSSYVTVTKLRDAILGRLNCD